jgi:hypothetical protein
MAGQRNALDPTAREPIRARQAATPGARARSHGPDRPLPGRPGRHGIRGAWLPDGSELDPQLVARASRLTAVSMDMTGGYAASVRQHAPQATIVIDNYHVVAVRHEAIRSCGV